MDVFSNLHDEISGLNTERTLSKFMKKHFTTLGTTILKLGVTLAGMGFVGLIIWGGLALTTDRSRELAMIAGGMVGALLAGLAFVIEHADRANGVFFVLRLLPEILDPV
jgi:hypothetical protein